MHSRVADDALMFGRLFPPGFELGLDEGENLPLTPGPSPGGRGEYS